MAVIHNVLLSSIFPSRYWPDLLRHQPRSILLSGITDISLNTMPHHAEKSEQTNIESRHTLLSLHNGSLFCFYGKCYRIRIQTERMMVIFHVLVSSGYFDIGLAETRVIRCNHSHEWSRLCSMLVTNRCGAERAERMKEGLYVEPSQRMGTLAQSSAAQPVWLSSAIVYEHKMKTRTP